MPSGSMHKVVIHKAGGYERLRLETHPVPNPGDRQVLIRTEAVGVNYADICVRWGVYESARRFVGWPITPGFEYSGWVEDVGREVKHVKPGDPVFGVTLFNGYSTHVCAPADLVWLKPQALDFEAAAGFLAVYLTAYHGLLQNVVIRPGMRVLVHSAGGGGQHLLNHPQTQGKAEVQPNSVADHFSRKVVAGITKVRIGFIPHG
jgi:NADPH:quinone reductase-like Zn-dependent oxidoreductase